MKVGIITLPLLTNYGGLLQAYALQTALERMGHEACHIQKRSYFKDRPLWKIPLTYGKRIYKNWIEHAGEPIFYEQKYIRELPVVGQNTDKFVHRYFKRKMVNGFSDMHEGDFDAIIVGSDQIWRPKYFYDQIERAYLDFTTGWNVKRIAYAASFGTDAWEYSAKQTSRCKRLASKFNAISVREKNGVDLCQQFLGVEAVHVLDPTMLLDKEDYMRLFENEGTPKSNGTLLTYILDDSLEKSRLIDRIASALHLIPFRVNSKSTRINAPVEERIQPSLESWLRGFFDAELIITDSFHACVFSILFGKPFIVIGNKRRGLSRFTSLLQMFGLEDCLLADASQTPLLTAYNPERVGELLNKNRECAMDFLKSALNM